MKTDISDLRAQLVEEAKSRSPQPAGKDEVTISMMAKELGCSRRTAGRTLNGMVEDGFATMRKNGPGGVNVYKKKG